MLLFPKELPRAHVRRMIADERKKRDLETTDEKADDKPASIKDMFVTS